VKIDPLTGFVVEIVSMSQLYPVRSRTADCLNGIAYDAGKQKFYLTGKKWPEMYEGVFNTVSAHDRELKS
jgi:glutaminyl-peptide cyclotransferase